MWLLLRIPERRAVPARGSAPSRARRPSRERAPRSRSRSPLAAVRAGPCLRAPATFVLSLLVAIACTIGLAHAQAPDPLPSWNDGASKARILAFVQAVTDKSGKDFVKPDDRVATFDNDGTLWCEQPIYVQLAFMLDQLKAAAPKHPEWKDNPAFKALAARDHAALAKLGHKPVLELLAVANSGMSVAAYDKTIRDWLETARHPRFKRPYTELVYKPMQELLAYLRANDFKTYIVSGGSIEFMRPWAEKAYGIPPDQVIGTITEVKFQTGKDGVPVLMRTPKIDFVDDGPGKPVGIYRHIGKRPVAAFGNSDGDLQMLQWTAAGEGPRFCLIVHHTDAEREWAYDRASHIGKLDKGLDEAKTKGWTVVDMKADWKTIFP
jgi:phosphoglycolate phosphatase-like HAD superfamily hydrolase